MSVGIDDLVKIDLSIHTQSLDCECVEPLFLVIFEKIAKQFQTKEFDPGSD